MELIRPENLPPFIANMNARPSITHEIGGLEDGSYGGIPSEFRLAAARMFTVDCKWHWTDLSWLARDAGRVCRSPRGRSSLILLHRVKYEAAKKKVPVVITQNRG
jgi:hypothetical protein